MAIGEFGGTPLSGGPVLSSGLYWFYELSHAALNPSRALADMTRLYFKNGRVKVSVSLAKGKKEFDKREAIKKREADRETRAAVKSKR